MSKQIIDLVNRYWKFDNDQCNLSTWHDKNDLIAEIEALILPVVSGSIGESTYGTLMTMTPKQIDKNEDVCKLCKYTKEPYDSEVCRYCRNENDGSQYYR